MHNLLVILIFTLRNFTKLPVLRYLGIYNVLHIWHIRTIPTCRVYRLYDTRASGSSVNQDFTFVYMIALDNPYLLYLGKGRLEKC